LRPELHLWKQRQRDHHQHAGLYGGRSAGLPLGGLEEENRRGGYCELHQLQPDYPKRVVNARHYHLREPFVIEVWHPRRGI
jgi:hypothetical protein